GDRQAFAVRSERGAAGHRPRLEHAIDLEAEIVVQARGIMALDDEAQVLVRTDGGIAGGLGCLAEIALGAVSCKIILTYSGGGTERGRAGSPGRRPVTNSPAPPPPAAAAPFALREPASLSHTPRA